MSAARPCLFLSLPGIRMLAYLIFPFRAAPGQLVCLCHFRDRLADLTRAIDSYLKFGEIDGYLVLPLFARRDRQSPFFRPSCRVETNPPAGP